jgi:UDP-N-acetylmuramate dehydrogenase
MIGRTGLTWQELLSRHLRADVPLNDLVSIRTGGSARWFLEVFDADTAVDAWLAARAQGIPVLFLGKGSNLLLPDEGYPGLVIHFGEGFSDMWLEGTHLHAQCGATLKALATFAADNNLAGLSFAAGIPGTLGGGLIMNAGAFNGEMSQVVASVDCVAPDGRRFSLSLEEAQLSYRHSRMMAEGLLVLGATLHLAPGQRDALYAAMAEFQALRRDKQPLSWPSAGSFFKRPAGYYAGALIEQAGLKGLTVGGAQVSEKHAGFLINIGGATSADFIALMKEVQRRVMERFGVALEPEVRIIPGERG